MSFSRKQAAVLKWLSTLFGPSRFERQMMSALTDMQASITALGVTADVVVQKVAALNMTINTTVASDEPALAQAKADLDAIKAKLDGI